ncbi:MAG: hypothetical protein Q9M92_11935 [Enterobacterales bacterium]|nr:hypothetical protein [Enterobacterales bacterium]
MKFSQIFSGVAVVSLLALSGCGGDINIVEGGQTTPINTPPLLLVAFSAQALQQKLAQLLVMPMFVKLRAL